MMRIAAGTLAFLAASAAAAQSAPAPSAGRGAVVFLQCRACHSIKPGEPNKIGPNLAGVAGARAASRPGYAYSAALASSDWAWTDARLDAFLQSPASAVPGTKMAFAGLKRAEDRAAVIAHLKSGGR